MLNSLRWKPVESKRWTVHVTLGVGFPLTLQIRETLVPSNGSRFALENFLFTVAGTGIHKSKTDTTVIRQQYGYKPSTSKAVC